MILLTEECLYTINGGDTADYDFGYKVGRAAKSVYNAVKKAYTTVKGWF